MEGPDQVQMSGLLAEMYRREPENPALKAWFAKEEPSPTGKPMESYRFDIMNFGDNTAPTKKRH